MAMVIRLYGVTNIVFETELELEGATWESQLCNSDAHCL